MPNGCRWSASKPATSPILPWSWRLVSNTRCKRSSALLIYESETWAMMAMTAPFLTDYDLYLLGEGNHYRIYEKLGAHVSKRDGIVGTHFAVWAPNARQVTVI